MNKKLKVALVAFICIVLFYVFGIGLSTKGDASSTKRIIRNNTLYTQSEIYSAMKVAKKEFVSSSRFKGAILKKLIFDGKEQDGAKERKKESNYDTVMYFSTYIVGAPIWQSGFFVNEYDFCTKENLWSYTVAKTKNGKWKVISQGY